MHSLGLRNVQILLAIPPLHWSSRNLHRSRVLLLPHQLYLERAFRKSLNPSSWNIDSGELTERGTDDRVSKWPRSRGHSRLFSVRSLVQLLGCSGCIISTWLLITGESVFQFIPLFLRFSWCPVESDGVQAILTRFCRSVQLSKLWNHPRQYLQLYPLHIS